MTTLYARLSVVGFCALACVVWQPIAVAETNVLVAKGATWKFLDDSTNPGLDWTELGFDDSQWNSGPAPLGYGEAGVIATPTAASALTNHFRLMFDIGALPPVSNLTLRVWRDDSATVYLNGEVLFGDTARNGEWTPPRVQTVASTSLRIGPNIVAVEVRQASALSTDLVFDLELFYTNAPLQPGVTITRPQNNALVRGGTNVIIEAVVTDIPGVERVEFFANETSLGADSVPSYALTWSNATVGSYILTSVAVTPTGSVTSAPVRLEVVSNIPPQVTITSPSDSSSFDEGDIPLRAVASDPDGSIDLVEFFEGDTRIGSASASPYAFTWSDVPVGDYSLTAHATDNEGLIRTSAVVRIQVRTPPPLTLVRGPYLQSGSPTGVTIRWRTDLAASSRVNYGTNPADLNLSVESAATRTEHELKLSELLPDTKYYYTIGPIASPLVSGPDYFFVTAPTNGKPTRIWALGDSGTASSQARQVADAYTNFSGARHTDLWLMLGDNAYGSGTDEQYQNAVFLMYPRMLQQSVLWPTLGNHDVSPAYFQIFTLPINGEAGGLPSGTENYYSFDYGNIHFVCLDSSFSSRDSNAPMCTWLRADLAANTKEWLIAFWHHPPYSKGSHNSDAEHELIAMRENAVPILEEYGVDLVLCGHSHCYERSFLMRGHYGHSSTLAPSMILDNGNGRPDDTGAYRKSISGDAAHHGTVYVVTGSSGGASFGSLDHPIMYIDYLVMGSLILDVDGPLLQAKFLDLDGTILDYFSIFKTSASFRITAMRVAGGDVHLTWDSAAGKRYQIEHASELSPTSFLPVGDTVPATGAVTTWTHQRPPGAALGFYRAREVNP